MGHDPAQPRSTTPSGQPHTRYHRARRQAVDDQGAALVRAANWRLAAFASFACTALAIAGLIAQSFKADVIPYLVEVESDGNVRIVGAVTEQTWTLTEAMQRAELTRFIIAMRSISSDRGVFTARQTYAMAHATPAARLAMERMIDKTRPFERFGTEVVEVEVTSMTRLKESQSWRAEWVETTLGAKNGGLIEQRRFVGIFHLRIERPEDTTELDRNPLGFFVHFFDIDAVSAD